MASTKKAKTLFQHLSGLKEYKTSWDSLSVMDKKTFDKNMNKVRVFARKL